MEEVAPDMECPFCGSEEHDVKDTRRDDDRIVRRRRCRNCSGDFKTREEVDGINVRVQKSAGDIEPFDPEKVRTGIARAVVLLSRLEDVDRILDRVLRRSMSASTDRVVSTKEIGAFVFDELLRQDPLGAVRFALVLQGRTDRASHGWSDANDFRAWLLGVFPELRNHRPPVDLTTVVKRDGSRQTFERLKLERSIGRAAKGRLEGDESVHRLATEVADSVLGELGDQPLVTTGQISAEILRTLRVRDHIAFMRFASTAKPYASVEDYESEAVALRNLPLRDAHAGTSGADPPL
jgi:transcriptional repressor NrdR